MLKNVRNSIFYRYLFSYLIILFIPLILMIVIVYGGFINTLSSELTKSNENMLSQVKDMVDDRMKELENMSISISTNYLLTPYMIRENGYGINKALQELKNYKSTNQFIDELYMYIIGDDIMYSSTGTCTVSNFIETIYRYNSWDKNQFCNDLDKINEVTVRPQENVKYIGDTKNIVTCIYPIPPIRNSPYAGVIFLIDSSAFTNMINGILKDYTGSVYILDENNHVIAASGTSIKDVQPFLSITNSENTITKIKQNGTEYSVALLKSDYNGWKYMAVLPTAQFFKKVVKMRSITEQVFIFILLFGVSFSVLISFSNYKPIGKLLNYLRYNLSSDKSIPTKTAGSEMDIIATAVDNIVDKNEELSSKLVWQSMLIKDRLVRLILEGADTDKWESLMLAADVHLKSKFYVTMLFKVDYDEEILKSRGYKENLIKKLEGIDIRDANGYGVDLLHEDIVAFIVGFSPQYNIKLWQQNTAGYILKALCSENQMKVTIYIGNAYENITSVHKSFIEAYAVLENKFDVGYNNIFFFEDIVSVMFNANCFSCPADEEIRFIQSIKQGDSNLAIDTIHHILVNIKNQRLPFYISKCILFDLINMIMKVTVSMNIVQEEIMNQYQELVLLAEGCKIESFSSEITKLCLVVCRNVGTMKESKNTMLKDRIIKYIEENYTDNTISLEGLADKFDISYAYLSRFFKDQVGESVIDYINNLRIVKVKNDLIYTNLSIKEIAYNAGFVDITSFTRKFKHMEGITPSQYRVNFAKVESIE